MVSWNITEYETKNHNMHYKYNMCIVICIIMYISKGSRKKGESDHVLHHLPEFAKIHVHWISDAT